MSKKMLDNEVQKAREEAVASITIWFDPNGLGMKIECDSSNESFFKKTLMPIYTLIANAWGEYSGAGVPTERRMIEGGKK